MEDKIDELVKRFTEIWFEKKLKQFVDPSKGYDPETNTRRIKTAGFNSNIDEETGQTFSEIAWEEVEEITLEEFCWCDNDKYNELRVYNLDEKANPIDAYVVLDMICEVVEELLPENDVQVSFNIINSASLIFNEKIKIIIAQSDCDNNFRQVCRSIADKGTLEIRKQFDRVVQQYIYGSKNGIQLQFELNKQQLAALIFLIDEAGMLTEKKRGAIGKYDFFEKHFNWTDPSDLSQNQLTGLKKNFSEFKNGVRINSVDEVFEMLKKANKNYIRSNW